jgi:protoheme IX farnesyltransferase
MEGLSVSKPLTLTAEQQSSSTDYSVGEPASVSDFWQLLKPRVMSLVVFTGFIGLLLAPGSIHPVLGVTAIMCIAVGAGASGALNMWFDADIDAKMKRTEDRPIPAGRMERGEALGFGATLSVASVSIMGLVVNWTSAALLALTIFYYVVIYSMWLKRRTPHNIVIGGAAGAFPPVIGWAAVTGSVSIEALVLFALIFFWTPPHFWALALFTREDYEKAGVPMLPVVSGEAETRKQIFLYSLFLAPLGLAPFFMGLAGLTYAAVAGTLGAVFLVAAYRVLKTTGYAEARQLFKFSIFYLFALFATLGFESIFMGGING